MNQNPNQPQIDQSLQPTVDAKLRNNNTLFYCALEDNKLYNFDNTKGYVVSIITNIFPAPQGGSQVVINSLLICEDCWNKNSGDKGLKLKDPVPATPKIITAANIPPGMNNIKR